MSEVEIICYVVVLWGLAGLVWTRRQLAEMDEDERRHLQRLDESRKRTRRLLEGGGA